ASSPASSSRWMAAWRSCKHRATGTAAGWPHAGGQAPSNCADRLVAVRRAGGIQESDCRAASGSQLRARELEQGPDVMLVGSAQRCDVARPHFVRLGKVGAPPGEPGPAQPQCEQVAGEAREAPAPVRERVDGNEAMGEPDGDLVGRIGVVLYPVARVADELRHLLRNAIGVDADIARRRSILPCPLPDLAEHALVKRAEESLVQHIATATKSPVAPFGDVSLFGFVQLGTNGDVGRDEPFAFLGT